MEINLTQVFSFNNESVLPLCYQERIIGGCYLVLFLTSVPANSTIIWTIAKHKKLQTNINYLILLLSVMNLLGSLIQLPLIIANAFNCSFLFDENGCLLSGVAYITSLSGSIYSFMMISIERYLVICTPFKTFKLNGKKTIITTISFTLFSSILWCLSPFAGWSRYIIDSGRVSCIVDANGPNEWWFILFLTFILYCIPLSGLVFANTAIILKVKESGKRFEKNDKKSSNLKKETYLVKVAIILIASFFIPGTSHVAMTLARMAYRESSILLLFDMIASFLMRSTVLWPSIINIFFNKNIKPFIFKRKEVNK